MADSIDPGDQAELSKLEAALRGLRSDVRAMGETQQEQVVAQDRTARQQARRDEERAARERRTIPRAAPPRGAADETPQDVEKGTRAEKDRTRATEQRTKATRSQGQALREQIRLERELARQRLLPATAGRFAAPVDPATRIAGYGAQTRGYAAEIQANSARVRAAQLELQIERARALQVAGTRANYRASRTPLALPAAGGTGGPPYVPPGTAAAAGSPEDQPRRHSVMADALAREQRATAGLHASSDELQNAYRRQVASVGLLSDAYRRHGALTTEFISAAARGQVTFRELEYQVGATIGKFAGWTAAAAAVYGVLGAVTALGQGAIESENGVQRLQRVVTTGFNADQLRGSFRDLQGEFNLPIDQVVDAVYGSAKIFNDQASAVEAARASLFAVKVGELDAATSTRYLNSIVAGFKLTAQDLPQVFDAINQAQNRFGGNTGQIVAGVAKAAGAFRLAGGSYKELIAIIQTGSRLTGAPGTEIGTAISRSTSRVLTKQGAAALREAGLTPGQPYIQLLRQAMDEAQGASPDRVNELARALVPQGGQYARIFAPLLQNRELYEKILTELEGDQTPGSASRELKRALAEPSEQIKQIYTNVQRLGSALAQMGALTPLGGLVRGINTSVDGMVQLVELFDTLTFGAGKVLIPIAEIAGLIALMRRLDLGGRLPVGQAGTGYEAFRGQLRRNPQALLDADIRRGQDEARKFVEDQSRITRTQAAQGAFRVQQEAGRVGAARYQHGAGLIDDAGLATAEARYNTRLQAAADLAADADALEAQSVAIRQETLAYDRARRSGLQAEAAAARAGIPYRPGGLDRPAPGVGPVPIVPGTTGRPQDVLRYIDEAERAAASQGVFSRGQQRVRDATQRLSASQSRSARALAAGAGVLTTAGAGAAALGSSVRRLGSVQIGALDGLLLGALAVYEVYRASSERRKLVEEQIAQLNRGAGPDPILTRDRARAQLKDGGGFFDRATDAFAQGYRRSDIGQIFGGAPQGYGERRREAARQQIQEAEALAKAQRGGALLPLDRIITRARGRVAAARTNSEKLDALNQELAEIGRSYAYGFGGEQAKAAADRLKNRVLAQIAAIKAGTGSIQVAIDNIKTLDALGEFVTQLQVDVQASPQVTRGQIRQSQVAAIAGARLYAQSKTPQGQLQALQQVKAAQDAILEAEEKQLQRMVEFAQTPAQSGRARTAFLRVARQVLIGQRKGEIDRLRNDQELRQGAIERAQQRVEGIDYSRRVNPLGGSPGDPALSRVRQNTQRLAQRRALLARIRRLRAANEQDDKAIEALENQLKVNREELKYIAEQQRRAQYEFSTQVYDSTTARLQSETADPLAQARILADRMVARVARAREAYRKGIINIGDLEQTLAQQNQALQAVAQQEVARFQAQQGLQSSQFALRVRGDQGATLKYAVGQANRFLGFVRSKGNKLDPATVLQAQQAVADAQLAYQQYLEEQARALEQAQINLALSKTEDPVKQALIRLRAARQQLSKAKTPADRVQAQADINNSRREAAQAQQQDKYDDLQFQYDLGKITKDAFISSLQALLKTIKGNKDLRRQIRRQISQLKKEIDSEADLQNLQVGDIRLPTVYEIRRAVQQSIGGKGDTRVQVVNQPNVTVQVNDPHQVGRVAAAIDQTLGTSTESSLRAAGLL